MDLQTFKSEFGEVRATEINGQPYFMANDIAKALGYAKPRNAVSAHCKGALKQDALTSGGVQSASFIPESDVYRLIIRSKLPTAEKFEEWVMEEVLPSIRKSGGYISGQENMTDAELLQAALEVANKQIAERDALIEAMRPKVLFAEAVTQSEDSLPIGDFAKILKQNGINTGRNRFMEYLRDSGYLIKGKESLNRPTQHSIERGLFEMKQTATSHGDGHISMHIITRITGKGQVYFMNKLVTERGYEQYIMQKSRRKKRRTH